MGVPGEPGQIFRRDVIAEVIKEKERVEVGGVAETKRTAQVNTRTFECRLCLTDFLNRSE
jgi:hypothetical protein